MSNYWWWVDVIIGGDGRGGPGFEWKKKECCQKRPKRHECVICGVEVAMGQALGGHLRRHRGLNLAAVEMKKTATTTEVAWLDMD
ncbi:Zinc finger protein ZAT5 [Linum perenne]